MLQRFGELAPEREGKFAPVNLQTVEADGTFSGYASVFGQVDLGKDLVMPGAFRESGSGAPKRSLRQRSISPPTRRAALSVQCSPSTEAGPRSRCGGQILGERY